MKPTIADLQYKPGETVADFKQRIAIMMRERETGKKYSVVGGPRAHSCVVRKRRPKCPNCGHDQDGQRPTHCLSCGWPLPE
jgi:hypothetical protein